MVENKKKESPRNILKKSPGERSRGNQINVKKQRELILDLINNTKDWHLFLALYSGEIQQLCCKTFNLLKTYEIHKGSVNCLASFSKEAEASSY